MRLIGKVPSLLYPFCNDQQLLYYHFFQKTKNSGKTAHQVQLFLRERVCKRRYVFAEGCALAAAPNNHLPPSFATPHDDDEASSPSCLWSNMATTTAYQVPSNLSSATVANTSSLLRIVALALISGAAIASRLFAVVNFESVIHELYVPSTSSEVIRY